MAKANKKFYQCLTVLLLTVFVAHSQMTPPPPGPPPPPGFPIDAGILGVLFVGLLYGIKNKVK